MITNPSSRYRPDGTSGIINIVLKKNTRFGLNGNVTANVGNRDRFNGNFSLNYRAGKFNLYSNYSLRKDTRIRTNTIDREYFDSAGKTSGYYFLDGESKGRVTSQSLTLGSDFSMNDHNIIGLSLTYFDRDMVRRDRLQNMFTDENGNITLHYDRLRYDPEPEYEKNISGYWQHNFQKRIMSFGLNSMHQKARTRKTMNTQIFITFLLHHLLSTIPLFWKVKISNN